ncbi:MAG: dTMP kinase [Alphaproteobacteria bacterium]|nr:dTMP kinase [Alphaproteobacteria bacterium]
MTKGLFITLEGGEGSGKSTQIERLKERLEKQGYDVVATREPGGTPEAEKIRDLLVQRDGGRWTPMAEVLLFFTARIMHVEDLIKPALAEGKIVISDRFTDSTRAYQSAGHGLPADQIEAINALCLNGFEPDLTLILDIDPKTGIERSLKENQTGGTENEDRFEKLDLRFHENLRQGYLDIAGHEPARCKIIDARDGITQIADQIAQSVFDKISAR